MKRFWDKVDVLSKDQCWEWAAGKDRNGYGRINIGGIPVLAHRFAYSAFFGEPAPPELDHLCRNTSCVNPYHLEDVTHRENVLRGIGFASRNAVKTHCPKGHPYTQNNIKYDSGSRKCRECLRLRASAYTYSKGSRCSVCNVSVSKDAKHCIKHR